MPSLNLERCNWLARLVADKPCAVEIGNLADAMGVVAWDGNAFRIRLAERLVASPAHVPYVLVHEALHARLGDLITSKPCSIEPSGPSLYERAREQVRSGGGLYWRRIVLDHFQSELRRDNKAIELVNSIDELRRNQGDRPLREWLFEVGPPPEG